MRTIERHATVPPKIRRGTPGPNGLVYSHRQIIKSVKGDFLVYHQWISAEEYRGSLTRLRGQSSARRRTREAQHVLGLHNIQGRVRDAACSLKFVDRRPRWYALEWLGCSLDEFHERFTDLFPAGMSWQEPRAWHMDHVVPVAVFDWTNPLSPYVCGHWSNYQPLRPVDNSRKHMRLDMEALEKVARSVPKTLLPVVRDLATLLEKTKLPAILCPEAAEPTPLEVHPTINVMYSIRPISSEDRDLLISPPPCPMYSEPHDFCSSLN